MNDPQILAQCVKATAGRHGTVLHLTNDGYIGRSLEEYGEFSEAEITLWAQYVHAGDIVFDIGANIGAHTVALAALVGPRGAVIAFEPIRFLYQLLCANAAINGLLNVRAYQVAVGREAGSVLVPPIDFTALDNFGGVPLGQWTEGERVEVVSLDEIARVPHCQFLKVDVEGMELDVLVGAERLITHHRPILYVERADGARGDAVVQWLAEHGYDVYAHAPPLFNPHNYFGKRVDVFAGQFEGQIHNLLCLPAGSPSPQLDRALVGPSEPVPPAGAVGPDHPLYETA